MARRLFTTEIGDFYVNILKGLRDTSVGGDGTVPGLKTVQVGTLNSFLSPGFDKLLDIVMFVPIGIAGDLGPQIQGSTFSYMYRMVYVHQWTSKERVPYTHIGLFEKMIEPLLNNPTLDGLSTPLGNVTILRAWVDRVEWEPIEDKMFDSRRELLLNTVACDITVETRARRV